MPNGLHSKGDDGQSFIHGIRYEGSLRKLLTDAVLAYRERTQVLQQQSVEIGLIGNRLENIHGLVFQLDRKVDTMSSNIDRIEKEAADAAENVELVRTAIEDLRSASADMKAEIASLKEQVAKGQLDQARLDAAAATFEKADDDIDGIVLPAPKPDTPPEG